IAFTCMHTFYYLFFFFFFFQAEDGIRDRNVTGVQTCALPICAHGRDLDPLGGLATIVAVNLHVEGERALGDRSHPLLVRLVDARSEERRVGKECRSRWARGQ